MSKICNPFLYLQWINGDICNPFLYLQWINGDFIIFFFSLLTSSQYKCEFETKNKPRFQLVLYCPADTSRVHWGLLAKQDSLHSNGTAGQRCLCNQRPASAKGVAFAPDSSLHSSLCNQRPASAKAAVWCISKTRRKPIVFWICFWKVLLHHNTFSNRFPSLIHNVTKSFPLYCCPILREMRCPYHLRQKQELTIQRDIIINGGRMVTVWRWLDKWLVDDGDWLGDDLLATRWLTTCWRSAGDLPTDDVLATCWLTACWWLCEFCNFLRNNVLSLLKNVTIW